MQSTQMLKQPMNLLVDSLIQKGILTSERVAMIMRKVDRGEFCPHSIAYEDCPQSINYGATISAPHMHAYALELLQDQLFPGSRVLDVGCGSGYLLAAFWEMMDRQGKVVGVEHIEQLKQFSLDNLNKSYSKEILSKDIEVICGDGREGYQKFAPYNVIHVGAAPEKVPKALLEQLALGGKMIIPVGGDGDQQVMLYRKDQNGKVFQKNLFGVRYVPLTSKEEQCPHLYQPKY